MTTHRFQTPYVVEIGPNGAYRTARAVTSKPSQRSLVEASLLRRPRDDESKRRD